MPTPLAPLANWRDASHYLRLEQLNPPDWAWQFLRRNSAYREQYRWFIARWLALEAAYGKAPERDMSGWKRDPRAYAPHEEERLESSSIGCVAENGRTLVECWIGARWGFYKFPVAPELERPAIPDTLLWRAPDSYTPTIQAVHQFSECEDEALLALQFDLEQPLKVQLEAAKRALALARRALAGQYEARRGRLESEWRLALRLLDAQDAGAPLVEVAERLKLTQEEASKALDRAQQLRDDDYRLLARRSWLDRHC